MLTDDELWSGIERLHSEGAIILSLSERKSHTIGRVNSAARKYTVFYEGRADKTAEVDFRKLSRLYGMVYSYGRISNIDMEDFGSDEIGMKAWRPPGSAMLAIIPLLDDDISVHSEIPVGLFAPQTNRFGLLVRMNPERYTNWAEEIPANGTEVEIEWRCNLKSGSVPQETPVFVLGTGGMGFVAEGCTLSDVRDMVGTPESWSVSDRDMGGVSPRIRLRLRRNMKSEGHLRNSKVDYLIERQGTFSWMNEDETFIIEDILD